MIVTGRSLCLPSPFTVSELFSVARDASIIPDISLDPDLTSYLSLDSSAALQHRYVAAQRTMSSQQQTAFSLSLAGEFGGSSTVAYGGVGVVALALSMLFDQVSQQIRAHDSTHIAQSSQSFHGNSIFGIGVSSRIGRMIDSYLRLIPGIANNQDKMAETTELYDTWLKLELLDHYERMTNKKRMSSEAMQQWLVGAAVHLHIRIHQVRLNSVPLGSAESLRLSYKSSLNRLVQGYEVYLHRNIQETAAKGPRRHRARTRGQATQNHTHSHTHSHTHRHTDCSSNALNSNISSNETTSNTTAAAGVKIRCKKSSEDFGLDRKILNNTAAQSPVEEAFSKGVLVIEPGRNVSHRVAHHVCEAPAIQTALVTRIINTQDLERNRNFFMFGEKVLHALLRQREEFQLKI